MKLIYTYPRVLLDPAVPDDKTGAASSATPDANAASSTATDDKPLAEIAAEIVAKAEKTEASSAKETDKADPDKETEEEEPSPEPEPEEETEKEEEEEVLSDKDKDVPFHDHPRWKEVLKQRNEADAKIKELEPGAKTAAQLSEYCASNNISNEDFTAALELMALSRKNPQEFRNRLETLVETIDITAGTKLPGDLQKKVDDGIMTAEDAKELAQWRVQNRQLKSQSQTAEERAAQQLDTSIRDGLTRWEASQKKTDTGYDNRREFMVERMHKLCAANPPRSLADAIVLAEQANKEVKQRLSKFRPKSVARRPLLSKGSSTNNGEEIALDDLHRDLPKLVASIASRSR